METTPCQIITTVVIGAILLVITIAALKISGVIDSIVKFVRTGIKIPVIDVGGIFAWNSVKYAFFALIIFLAASSINNFRTNTKIVDCKTNDSLKVSSNLSMVINCGCK